MGKKRWIFALLCVFICTSCSRTLHDTEVRKVFDEHYSELGELKDMIISETDILAIGYDNVGDFWLDQGRWTTHKPPYTSYTEDEMLHLVGLAQERYHKYLQLIESVNGYRITKSISNKRISIHLSRVGNVSSGQTVNIVFLLDAPALLVNDTEKNANDNSRVWYSRLEGNWYIEREK